MKKNSRIHLLRRLGSGTAGRVFAMVSCQAMTEFVSVRCFCALVGILLLILSSPCSAQSISSQFVREVHTSVPGEGCSGACELTINVPSSLAGNLLVVDFSWSYGGTAPAVSNIYCNSDTTHATWTWTLAKNVLDTGDSTDSFKYFTAGATAGCSSVTIVASAVWTNAEAVYKEYRGIAASSPIDGTAGQVNSGTGPNFNPGPLTTTTNGDLIDQYCTFAPLPFGAPNATSITGSGGFTLIDADLMFGYASMAQIQTSSGAVTPSINFVGGPSGGNGICIAAAFKTSASTGTAPSGIQIISQEDAFGNTPTTYIQIHVFNPGDTLVIEGLSTQATGNNQWSSISDSLGSSFTTHQLADSGGGYPAWAVDCSAPSVGDDKITISGASSSGNGNYVVLEIAGLNNSSHTACFDATAGLKTNWGNNAPYSSAPSITPSTAGGIILAAIEEGIGPISGISSPNGAIYAYPNYTGITDASQMTEGGGFSYLLNTSTNANSWTWTSPNSTAWNASAIALVAGSSQGGLPSPPTALKATVQ